VSRSLQTVYKHHDQESAPTHATDPDYQLTEADFLACNALGAEEGVWCGVMEEHGLRWSGNEVSAAIVHGFSEHLRDFAP
jgi:hypothetical protein